MATKATHRNGDFPDSVKRRLKDRVNSICSNPNCRKLTEAPSSENTSKVNSIGIAAHICAASPEGPLKMEFGYVQIAQFLLIEMLQPIVLIC